MVLLFGGLGLLCQLANLALDDPPFQAAYSVDEEYPLEMIDLMLQGHGKEPLGLDLSLSLIQVMSPDEDPLGPSDVF